MVLLKSDSHTKNYHLINKKFEYLNKNDFYPFKNKKSHFRNDWHILFLKKLIKKTVTHSKKIINLIKKKIGFKNIN